MELDPSSLDRDSTYRVMTSLVAPRPIGWISTVDADGASNLAPYSNFNKAATDPPVVMFSAGPREDGSMKRTPRNVLETGEFVTNLATEALIGPVDETSAVPERDFDPSTVSKFDLAGVTPAPSKTVDPPRVSEASACFECSLLDSFDVHGYTLVLGEVVHMTIDDTLLTDGQVDMTKVHAIGRVGGPYYTRTSLLERTRAH